MLGADVGDLFNFLTGYSRHTRYRKLIVAPGALRQRVVELIERETRGRAPRAASPSRSTASPTPRSSTRSTGRSIAGRARSTSSCAACAACGRACPGCPRPSRCARSSGRFLEHSRIYRFGGIHDRPLTLLLGSADLMERNLDRRIELLVPGRTTPSSRPRVLEVLELNLADDMNAWVLGPDGAWTRVPTDARA